MKFRKFWPLFFQKCPSVLSFKDSKYTSIRLLEVMLSQLTDVMFWILSFFPLVSFWALATAMFSGF